MSKKTAYCILGLTAVTNEPSRVSPLPSTVVTSFLSGMNHQVIHLGPGKWRVETLKSDGMLRWVLKFQTV